MFNKKLKQEINNLQYKCENLEKQSEKLLQRIDELKLEKEEIINNKIEELVKDCHISDFMKIIQLMAKEKIKTNDDVYLVSYYVDLYKFIEDLKHSYMHR